MYARKERSHHGGRSWEIIRDEKTSEVSDLVVDKRYLSKHKHDDAGQIATKQNGKPRRRMTGASCSATPRSSRGRNCIARSLRIWCLKSNRGEKKNKEKRGATRWATREQSWRGDRRLVPRRRVGHLAGVRWDCSLVETWRKLC